MLVRKIQFCKPKFCFLHSVWIAEKCFYEGDRPGDVKHCPLWNHSPPNSNQAGASYSITPPLWSCGPLFPHLNLIRWFLTPIQSQWVIKLCEPRWSAVSLSRPVVSRLLLNNHSVALQSYAQWAFPLSPATLFSDFFITSNIKESGIPCFPGPLILMVLGFLELNGALGEVAHTSEMPTPFPHFGSPPPEYLRIITNGVQPADYDSWLWHVCSSVGGISALEGH